MRNLKFLTTLLLVVALNVASTFVFARFDLTNGKIHTLSDSTKQVLRKMKTPLELTVFLSEKLPPQVMNIKQGLRDTIDEYSALSGGNLRVTYLDPDQDEKGKTLAPALGMIPMNLQVVEQDQRQVMKVYVGIGVLKQKKGVKEEKEKPLATYEKWETIPNIPELSHLEYDLTAAILKISAEKPKTVGFLTGHDEHGLEMTQTQQPDNPFAAMFQDQSSSPNNDYPFTDALNKNYKTTQIQIDPKKPTIEGINTLVIAGPRRALSSDEIKAVHTFVEQGGNAIILLDQIHVETGLMAIRQDADFSPLLARWGISLSPEILKDASHANANFSQGFMTFSLPFPFWVKASVSETSTVTSQLPSVILPWVAPLQVTTLSGVTVETLAKSSENYTFTTSGAIDLNPQQNFAIPENQKPSLPLAVLASKAGEGKVIIVGSSAFANKNFSEQFEENRAFFLNSIDALTMGDTLISIRSKGIIDRPLAKLSESEKNTIKWGLTLIIPLCFVGYGLIRRGNRRKMKKKSQW